MRILNSPLNVIRTVVGLIVNPIFLKELKVSSRRKRTYLLRAGYLLLLVSALLMTWWVVVQGSLTQSSAEALQRQSQTGQTLSYTLAWIQFVSLLLIAPMLTGSCVSDEIEDRSLDVLLITPLTAAQIIVGKLLSRLVYVALLVLLSAPLLLAMRTYGGFTLSQLAQLEALSLTTALLGASVSILLSCWEARGWRAVAMTYFWLALWWFVIPLLVVAGLGLVLSLLRPLAPWIPGDLWEVGLASYPALMLHTNPVMTMGYLTIEAAGGPVIPWVTSFMFLSVNLVNMVLSAGLIALAVPLLRRTANKRLATAEQKATLWIVGVFRSRRAAALPGQAGTVADAASEEPGGNVATNAPAADLPVPRVWEHAVLWREMRSRLARRPLSVAIAGAIVVALVIFYNVQANVQNDREMLLPLIWLAFIAQLVIAWVVSPTVIASEKQAQSWDVLLCVPTSPLTILWSKAVGSLKASLIPIGALVLEMLYYSAFHRSLMLVTLQVALVSIAFATFLACAGVMLSLLCKRSMTAMAANLGVAILLWGGLPAVIGIVSALRGWNSRIDDMIGVTFLINPFYWMGVISNYLASSAWRASPTYDLGFWRSDLSTGEFTWAVVFVSAVMVAAGFGLLYAGATWFNRWTGRSS